MYNYSEYSIWVSTSSAGSGSSESSSAFYGIFIAEGTDGVGDMGSVGTPVDDKWHSKRPF
jgi:hypothetical protein